MACAYGTKQSRDTARHGQPTYCYPPQEKAMPHTTPLIRFRTTAGISLVIGMALLAGCAQQQTAGYYDTPHESTLSDAEQHAQGRRGARAPSQLQLGFGDSETTRNAQQAKATTDANASNQDM